MRHVPNAPWESDNRLMARLPLFPLSIVLSPGTILPLAVFEPRYRALVTDLLDGPDAPEFGVVALRSGNEVGAGRQPDIAHVGCTAVLQHVDSLRPGTFRVKARGTQRFLLRRILPDPAPYLVGDVTWLPEQDGDTRVLPGLARTVRELLARYNDMLGLEHDAPSYRRDLDAARRLSYEVADRLLLPLNVKLQLLEAATTQQRLETACALLAREIDLYALFGALPHIPDATRLPLN